MNEVQNQRYRDAYSADRFWDKLGRFARVAGRQLVERALLLYLVLKDPATPTWARTTIIGALGYFISPVDALPDFLPAVGFTDDLGVLIAALGAVAASITPQMRTAARRTAERLFGGHGDERVPEGMVIEAEATLIERQPG